MGSKANLAVTSRVPIYIFIGALVLIAIMIKEWRKTFECLGQQWNEFKEFLKELPKKFNDYIGPHCNECGRLCEEDHLYCGKCGIRMAHLFLVTGELTRGRSPKSDSYFSEGYKKASREAVETCDAEKAYELLKNNPLTERVERSFYLKMVELGKK